MTDTYSSTDTPEYQGDAPEQKVSQTDANYRKGSPVEHCGLCQYFEGGDQCSQVEGPISPYGISDIYRSRKNPWGPTLGPQERTAIRNMMNSPPDQSMPAQAAPPPPQGLRIGNRSYS